MDFQVHDLQRQIDTVRANLGNQEAQLHQAILEVKIANVKDDRDGAETAQARADNLQSVVSMLRDELSSLEA